MDEGQEEIVKKETLTQLSCATSIALNLIVRPLLPLYSVAKTVGESNPEIRVRFTDLPLEYLTSWM